ncbi:MAG: endonuclease/exonuclease/phosphatase family protein, partial [Myxococcota bacterium]
WSLAQAAALDADNLTVSAAEWQIFSDTIAKVLPRGARDVALLRDNRQGELREEFGQARKAYELQHWQARIGTADAAADAAMELGNRGEGVQLRIVASNLTSGPDQAYIEHGARILTALKPDVVLMQELNTGGESTEQFVNRVFGPGFFFFRGIGKIPNGIVSRYPIVEAGEWDDFIVHDREVSWARINVPGERDLWAISVHLKAGGDSARDRVRETNDIVTQIRARIPEGDYLVMGGDFNTSNRTEQAVKALASVFDVGAPFPTDQAGNGDTNANRNKPYDWVLADKDLAPFEVSVSLGASWNAPGLVFDSRAFKTLDDVPPVQKGDSGAANMQHMAVVRQFTIPAPSAK